MPAIGPLGSLFKMVRNASPFWYIYRCHPNKVTGTYMPAPMGLLSGNVIYGEKGKDSAYDIPMHIYRKINEIKWTQASMAAPTGSIVFSNLTPTEANHTMFRPYSNAFMIYAGWWDWWGLSRSALNVFNGQIQNVNVKYEATGIRLELKLQDCGGIGLRRIVNMVEVGLSKATTPIEALSMIAKYVGLELAVQWGDSSQDFTIAEVCARQKAEIGAAGMGKPWILPAAYMQGGMAVPVTLKTVLDNMAKYYKKGWHVEEGVLFFGIYKKDNSVLSEYGTARPERVFLYRTGHEISSIYSDAQSRMHAEFATFTSADVDDPYLQAPMGISSATVAKDKSAKAAGATKQGVNDVVNFYIKNFGVTLREDSIIYKEALALYNQAMAQKEAMDKTIQATAVSANAEDVALKAIGQGYVPFGIPGQADDDLVELQKATGFDLTTKGTIKLNLDGCLGEPGLCIGDSIFFKGIDRHTGLWYTDEISQSIQAGGMQYVMSLKCSRSIPTGLSLLPKPLQDAYNKSQEMTAKYNAKSDLVNVYYTTRSVRRNEYDVIVAKTKALVGG
jgi:hypothetical protein